MNLENKVVSLDSYRSDKELPLQPVIADSQNWGPIESEMRQTLSKLKNTSYKDQFDWSIYDKIAARFGNEPPNGGVVFRTTFKLANYHSTCSKCHYALEIDTYGRGCVHNCVYCYAKDQLTKRGYWNRPTPFPVDLAEIRNAFYIVFETNKPHKWRSILEKRVPLRIGAMSDSFMWMDLRYGITKEFLRILKHYEYPAVIFTRSDLVAHDDYMKEMDPRFLSIQFSIAGNNEELTKKIEPGAPAVSRRLKAIKKLSESGFLTAARLNPLFPIYPDGYFSDSEKVLQRFNGREIPKFDLFDFDFISELAEYKPHTVLAGFVRLSTPAINSITKATGVDFREFFTPETMQANGDKKFSDAEIAYYYKEISKRSREAGLRFTTCYIGNGIKDYFQYQKLWSNKSDCCDIVGNIESFKKTSQSISWAEREKHAAYKNLVADSKREEEDADKLFGKSQPIPERRDLELNP